MSLEDVVKLNQQQIEVDLMRLVSDSEVQLG